MLGVVQEDVYKRQVTIRSEIRPGDGSLASAAKAGTANTATIKSIAKKEAISRFM